MTPPIISLFDLTKIMKDNKDLLFIFYFLQALTMLGVFPDELKHADIKPIYKKESRNEKENYRPVRFLPNLSKIFERCTYDQLKNCFDKILSKYQCGFRKGFSTQHCLLAMIKNYEIVLTVGDFRCSFD